MITILEVGKTYEGQRIDGASTLLPIYSFTVEAITQHYAIGGELLWHVHYVSMGISGDFPLITALDAIADGNWRVQLQGDKGVINEQSG